MEELAEVAKVAEVEEMAAPPVERMVGRCLVERGGATAAVAGDGGFESQQPLL